MCSRAPLALPDNATKPSVLLQQAVPSAGSPSKPYSLAPLCRCLCPAAMQHTYRPKRPCATATQSAAPVQTLLHLPNALRHRTLSHMLHALCQHTSSRCGMSDTISTQQRIAGGLEHAVLAASQDWNRALTDSPVALAGQAVAADCDMACVPMV